MLLFPSLNVPVLILWWLYRAHQLPFSCLEKEKLIFRGNFEFFLYIFPYRWWYFEFSKFCHICFLSWQKQTKNNWSMFHNIPQHNTTRTRFFQNITIYKKNNTKRIQNSHKRLSPISLTIWSNKTSQIRFSSHKRHLLFKKIPSHDMTQFEHINQYYSVLGSSVSSTEKDIDTRLTKAWTAIDRLSDLTDKMKRSFFRAAVVSILLYGCTTWTLTKRLEKKLDGNYTRMLRVTPHKAPTIQPPASHHENYPS